MAAPDFRKAKAEWHIRCPTVRRIKGKASAHEFRTLRFVVTRITVWEGVPTADGSGPGA